MSRVVVVGAGTMGSGIAHVFAQSGWDVAMVDTAQSVLDRALETMRKNLDRQVRKGSLTSDAAASAVSRVSVGTTLDGTGADLAVEAVIEDSDVKRRVFRDLDAALPPAATLASNTSSISITALAAATRRPAQVIGMHFMNPVPVMPLVEVIRGRETSDATTERVVAIAQALGKRPVVVRDSPGFVANRVLMPMINEAVFCVMEGVAAPEDVDAVMKLGMSHPLGPLALADLIGLDVCLAILQVLHRDLKDDKYRPAPLLAQLVAAGRLGKKSGHGFYVYRD
ncbi:MAG TPA: 3-hydroxyacyl-CoA dehydrogenase NAD-binding domain-containing protein [Gemmatimonadales bacterium]|nr:3-hydroxyacyl-CoA dehydrogenase NAD-binding domain-containing protein [Gemmatimonadales bacterium]